MNLVEIAYPTGALTPDDRALVAAHVIEGLVGEGAHEGTVPEETMAGARATTHVGFRDLATWTTGDGPWDPSTPPPVWITMTVPEAWREEAAPHLIGRLRSAVRRLDNEHGWRRPRGFLWINIVGIADGSIGIDGKPASAAAVIDFITAEFRAKLEAGTADVPDGVTIDPICQMHVKLGPDAITLEHDGQVVGFCATACRAAYAREHGIDLRRLG
jgi:hypothetical protein